MIDGCGREIDHLRLSLTDHCNLACRYCVPEGVTLNGRMIDAALAFALVHRLSEQHGIRHLRLTGGEPLLYPDLLPLLKRLGALGSLHEITMTTNAQALKQQAAALNAAGLSRINISLDTLDPDRFADVTRGGNLSHTLAGIEAAVETGLTPVKLNVVAQRGVNHDELPELAEWGLTHGCIVRFLEVMPLGPEALTFEQHLVPAVEILERLGERFELRKMPQPLGAPSVDYAAKSPTAEGVIGLIAWTTRPFCERCRRLRITARGALVPCLHDAQSYDLMPFWDGEQLDVAGVDALVLRAVKNKAAEGPRGQSLTMLSLGG